MSVVPVFVQWPGSSVARAERGTWHQVCPPATWLPTAPCVGMGMGQMQSVVNFPMGRNKVCLIPCSPVLQEMFVWSV